MSTIIIFIIEIIIPIAWGVRKSNTDEIISSMALGDCF